MSLQLAEEIIKGRRLKQGEDLSFLLVRIWMSFVRELIKSGRSSAETMWICVLSLMDEADAAARTASLRAVSLSSYEGGRISISGARGDSGGLQAS